MILEKLIKEYIEAASACATVDYSDEESVNLNNKAVDRMYEIVNQIKNNFGHEGTLEFAKLLNTRQYRTDLWASVQMLETMTVDKQTETEALKIIKAESKQSIGMEYWLKEYLEKKKQK